MTMPVNVAKPNIRHCSFAKSPPAAPTQLGTGEAMTSPLVKVIG